MSYRTKSDNEPFDSYREFLDNISRGGEVVFYYNENKYTLTHGTDNDGVKLVYFGIVDSVSEYKTAGYGFVEQTDPFLGKFLNVKKDAEMYVPRILVTKTKNAINQAQKN